MSLVGSRMFGALSALKTIATRFDQLAVAGEGIVSPTQPFFGNTVKRPISAQ
jgi:hypothetical protein